MYLMFAVFLSGNKMSVAQDMRTCTNALSILTVNITVLINLLSQASMLCLLVTFGSSAKDSRAYRNLLFQVFFISVNHLQTGQALEGLIKEFRVPQATQLEYSIY